MCHLDFWLLSGVLVSLVLAGRSCNIILQVNCFRAAGWGVKSHKQSLYVCMCAANMPQPNGGIFSHLRSSASQMAAMLMNPTGCCDTTASGRSKWGFGVEQVCVQTCVFRRRASVCADASFQSKVGMRCSCSEVHQGGANRETAASDSEKESRETTCHTDTGDGRHRWLFTLLSN